MQSFGIFNHVAFKFLPDNFWLVRRFCQGVNCTVLIQELYSGSTFNFNYVRTVTDCVN